MRISKIGEKERKEINLYTCNDYRSSSVWSSLSHMAPPGCADIADKSYANPERSQSNAVPALFYGRTRRDSTRLKTASV